MDGQIYLLLFVIVYIYYKLSSGNYLFMQYPKDQFHKYIVNNHYQQLVPRSELSQQENFRYYEQYKKLYYTASCIHTQFNQLNKLKLELLQKITNTETNIENYKRSYRNSLDDRTNPGKPRRFRRTNQMIDKPHRCIFTKCDKSYASEGSLQQHIKLKHDQQTPPPERGHSHHFRMKVLKRQRRNNSNQQDNQNFNQGSEGFQNESSSQLHDNRNIRKRKKRQQGQSQEQNSQLEQNQQSSQHKNRSIRIVKKQAQLKPIKRQVDQ